MNCNKIKNLTINPEDIVKAVEDSDVLTVSDCKTKICRLKPIEDKTPEDVERCTVYVVSSDLNAFCINIVYFIFCIYIFF